MLIYLCFFQIFVCLLTTLPTLVALPTAPEESSSSNDFVQTTLLLELLCVAIVAALFVKYILPVSKKQSKSIQSCTAFLSVSATYAYRRPGTVHTFVNPLGFSSILTWMGLLIAKVVALQFLDQIVLKVVRKCVKPKQLQFRTSHPKVLGLQKLEWIDFTYLSMNQVIEYIFALNVVDFSLKQQYVYWSVSNISILNTVVALYLLFVLDDLLYAPTHYFMHWKRIYPYIHKHHHRQNLPKRGYTDAGNEHPLEQVVGLSIVWITLHCIRMVVGIHVITILLHFILYAALALLNHTDMDVKFQFLGFHYSVGAHEMHHRNPDCNMAQYWMGLDQYVLGTYRPYTDGKTFVRGNKKQKQETKSLEMKNELNGVGKM